MASWRCWRSWRLPALCVVLLTSCTQAPDDTARNDASDGGIDAPAGDAPASDSGADAGADAAPSTAACEPGPPLEWPSVDCAATAASQAIIDPFMGAVGESPNVTVAQTAGGMLYVGFSLLTCSAGCASLAGLYRTDGGAWQTVVPGEANVALAAGEQHLFWARSSPTDPLEPGDPIHHVAVDTLASEVAGNFATPGFMFGLAATPDQLFSMVAAPDFSRTALEARTFGADGLISSVTLLAQIPGRAYWPRTNGNMLVWAEVGTVVASDLAGNRMHVATLPQGSVLDDLAVAGDTTFAAFETSPGVGEICALSLGTGVASEVVPGRAGIQICDIAANGTSLYWSQASETGHYCDTVWTRSLAPLGPPELVACSTTSIQAIAADDHALYWIDGGVHRLAL